MMVIASQHLSSWASPSFVIVVSLLESSSVPSVCSLSDIWLIVRCIGCSCAIEALILRRRHRPPSEESLARLVEDNFQTVEDIIHFLRTIRSMMPVYTVFCYGLHTMLLYCRSPWRPLACSSGSRCM